MASQDGDPGPGSTDPINPPLFSTSPSPQTTLPFLTSEEEATLLDTVRSKLITTFQDLTRNFHNAVNQKEKDRIAFEQRVSNLESQLKEHREKTDSLNSQLMTERKTTEEYIERYRKALTSTNELEDSVRKLQTSLTETQVKFEQLKGEKDEILSIADNRNNEIEKLNADVANLSQQLQSATMAKIEALVKVDELTSKEMELDYKEKQIEKERDWVSKQVQLLNEELDKKNSEIIEIQRDNNLRYLNLQTEVSEKAEQLRIAELSLESVKSSNEKQEQHISRLIEKLKDAQDMETKMEENYRQELKSQKRIAELYKDSSEESSKKVEELEDAVSNLQDLLKMATERYGELETQFNKSGKCFQEEITKRDEKIENLTVEISHANDLLSSIKKQGMTDEMILSLSPAAAAASSMLKNTHSLTEVYSRYQSLQQALQQTREENEKLNNYINQILKDIEDRGPILQAQKEDYERALETVSALTNQLDLSMESETRAKEEFAQARKSLGVFERENARLKVQLTDSAIQIKTLLREVEANRGNYKFADPADTDDQEMSLTNSSSVITSRLVTFKNIDELQSQNQYLLSIVRELSEERENAKDNVDQNQISEIKEAFEAARKELEDLRELRLRQERMFQSVLEQRDSYASLLEQKKSPFKSSPLKSSTVFNSSPVEVQAQEELDRKLFEMTTTLKQVREEYDTYRKEKSEHEKIASEQMERLRDDLTRMRTDNAKLASQSEYNNERAKIYTANLESYKKNMAILEEKNKACALTIMKHEQSIVGLKAELSTTAQKLARTEVSLATMAQERNTLRDAKSRLQAERDLFQREQSTQKILQTNLADIKNNLEMSNCAAKIKLENQVETLQKENAILRRKVDSENNTFKDTVLSWDKLNKELQAKVEKEEEVVQNLRKELTQSQETIRTQRSEIDELLSKVRVLTGTGYTTPEQLLSAADKQSETFLSLAQIELEKKTKELNLKLIEAQTEIRSLKQQIEISKGSVEEYKSLCQAMEEQLKTATEGTKNFNTELQERLACKDDIIREIQAKLDAIDKENTSLKEEKERILREIEGKSTSLDDELTRMRRELQVANSRLQSSVEESVKVKTELERQVQMTQEFQTLYEREMNQQSSLNESQATLASELDSLRSRIGEDERARLRAEEKLKEIEESWEDEVAVYKTELSQVKANLKEVDELNSSLQDQLVTITTQMSSLRQVEGNAALAAAADQSLNRSASSADVSFSTSFLDQQDDSSDQERKTTEQWLQLIRYMRRQKEIAYTKTEMAEATVQRLESQLKFTEKQLEELKCKLNENQESSHYTVLTSAKQTELLRKVETLSALTDSNRMLREEKEAAMAEIQSLKKMVERLENELSPLRLQNSELESKCEALANENTGLKQDLTRWRARAAMLLEKTTKINPEEWKKLQTEKDTLNRQCVNFQETIKRQQTEIARHVQQVKMLQQQVTALQTNAATLTQEKKTLTETGKKASEDRTRLQTENTALKGENTTVKADLTAKEKEVAELQANLTKAQAEIEEQKGVVRQVKGIARKYKKSYEDSLKDVETLQAQKDALEAQASTSSSAAATAAVESESNRQQATEAEAANLEQMRSLESRIEELTNENQGLKRDNEAFTNRESRAKAAITLLRDKNNASTQQKTEIEAELAACKEKIASLEVSSEESAVRLAALKSQYEGRLGRLEKENKDLKGGQGSSQSSGQGTSQQDNHQIQQENERLKKESEMQKQRILALEKQIILKQTTAAGTSKPSTSGGSENKGPEPPMANIKPIAGTSSGNKQTTQVVQPGNARPQPTASIRPMSMTRKVLVMPNASSITAPPASTAVTISTQGSTSGSTSSQSQQSTVQTVVVAPVSQAQVSTSTPDQSSNSSDSSHHPPVTSSASTATVTNSTNVRQVMVQPTPTVSVAPIASAGHSAAPTGSTGGISVTAPSTDRESQPTGSGSQQEGPSTSSSHMEDSEMGDSSEQVSSSEPSSHGPTLTVAPLRSQGPSDQSVSQPGSSHHTETQAIREEPSPSTSTSGARPTQSTKRTRDDEVEGSATGGEPETKRTRVSRSMPVEREAEAMAHQQEDMEDEQDEEVDEEEEEEEEEPPASSARRQDEDSDSDVIVIESDEEFEEPRRTGSHHQQVQQEEEDDVDEEVGEEEEDEDEDVDAEEEVDEDELEEGEERDEDDEEDAEAMHEQRQDPDEDVDVDEEGREAESMEDQEDGEGESQEGEAGMLIEEQEVNEEDDEEEGEDNIVQEEINLVDEDEENQEAGEASPMMEAARPQSSSTSRPQPLARQQARQERLPSYGRQQPPMTPSFHNVSYGDGDEIDDSIVPSTPTLFMPRRSDGFAEAVSSPHTHSQARFTFSTPSDTATTSGMDDARLDLHYDEGSSGRSVPTTPLQVSPPAEMGDIEAVVNSVEEGDEFSRESQPSSSDATRHGAFANVPSITITSVSGSYSDTPREQEPSDLQTQHDNASAEVEYINEGAVGPPRTESSVTSSDEDKIDHGTGSTTDTTDTTQPSTSSQYRSTSPTPSTGVSQSPQGSNEQHSMPQQHRVRPTPIVWDQPTSSMPQPIAQQVPRSVRGGGRGMSRGGPGGAIPLMHLAPDLGPPGFRPSRGSQSARRSRPHGPRGAPMRGPNPRQPY